MTIDQFKKIKLPDNPGVYFFKKGKDILYIGKATSLADRVKSYFSSDLIKTRGLLLVDMVTKAEDITYEETGSVLEALLLESELIKKYQPYYNSKEKDDKSHSYVVITKEEYPTIFIVRGHNLNRHDKNHYSHVFGPFVSGMQIRDGLKIIRKIFPYKDEKCTANSGKQCFNASIGLCPGVCVGRISKKEYAKDVKNIALFLSGHVQKIVKVLEKEMNDCAKKMEFEKANKIKNKIYALNHIRDVSLIKKERQESIKSDGSVVKGVRIEAYDVAHMQGKHMIGVMVVMKDGVFAQNEYKKFIIKSVKNSNDPAALKEIITRRMNHEEWDMPTVIVVDGNEVQKKVAEDVLNKCQKGSIVVISVVKDDKHKAKDILGNIIEGVTPDDIYKINAEAHRFAIKYFREKQRKDTLK